MGRNGRECPKNNCLAMAFGLAPTPQTMCIFLHSAWRHTKSGHWAGFLIKSSYRDNGLYNTNYKYVNIRKWLADTVRVRQSV